MKFSLGIREQLTAGIVLTTLAGIGLVGVIAIKIVETHAVFSKVREAHKTARFAGLAMRTGDTQAEVARMKKFAVSALSESGVGVFRLTDGRGRVVLQEGVMPVRVGSKPQGRKLPARDGLEVRLIGGGFLSGPGTALYVSAPVGKTSKADGNLEFMVPLADIREDMSGVRRFLIFYALVDSVIIIGFGGYYLSRRIVRPVKELKEAATRIAGGALGERAGVEVDNEIGSLARSFNVMAERLESQIKTLERVNLELVSTQDELLRSKTLAAVGGLAAGLAHEIGNPLGAVTGYMELLKRGGLERDDFQEILKRATREIMRIDTLLKEFLVMSRPPQKPTVPVDVNNLIEDTLRTVAVREDFSGVDIKTDLADTLPHVPMEEGKLRQVFMNLLINAAQSMGDSPDEKVIEVRSRVSTEKTPAETAPRRRKDDPPGPPPGEEITRESVVVCISDRGAGISEDHADKVFEPFFTTKEVGRGTGLGLFVSRTIVKAYGGDVGFSTKEGEGSTFTVRLPAEG